MPASHQTRQPKQAEPDEESYIFYTFTRSEGEEIRLRLRKYRGQYYIDFRHWFQPEGQTELVATKRGVSIPAECLSEVLDGFEQLRQMALKAATAPPPLPPKRRPTQAWAR